MLEGLTFAHTMMRVPIAAIELIKAHWLGAVFGRVRLTTADMVYTRVFVARTLRCYAITHPILELLDDEDEIEMRVSLEANYDGWPITRKLVCLVDPDNDKAFYVTDSWRKS